MERDLTENELIAAFMGDREDIINDPKWATGDELVYLRYHKSWDWLMPVVEKIEKLKELRCGYIVTFGTGMVTGIYFCNIQKPKLGTYSQGDVVNPNFITNIESLSSKIDAVYKAVVEFIQWYNQNRKQ